MGSENTSNQDDQTKPRKVIWQICQFILYILADKGTGRTKCRVISGLLDIVINFLSWTKRDSSSADGKRPVKKILFIFHYMYTGI